MTEPVNAMLDELSTEAAVLLVYRQAFAVVAREAWAMILDADLIGADETILEAFVAAGSERIKGRRDGRRVSLARRTRGYGVWVGCATTGPLG